MINNKYNIKNFATASILVSGLVGLLGCAPRVEVCKDVTGDGICDVVTSADFGFKKISWLNVGKADGTYDRAAQTEDDMKRECYETQSGVRYYKFGENYVVLDEKK